ncbi:MAG: tRNA (guanine-N7-)-methyltransferase [Rhodospirillaceae bacterium]|jgi:tRNA (guanine-N7-)-methyltransferase|nr:tRNA (guanine-N7-)-methyltransferase [Rhodospirillaceae bacterium]
MSSLLPALQFDPAAPLPEGPLWLEIGFGAGEHLAWQAAAQPAVTLIGCELYRNGIAALLGHVEREKLGNIRLWPDDARDLIDLLPDCVLDRVFLLFPDPWPKARHAERRFIGPANLDGLARVMQPGAQLRVATDDPVYLRWVLDHLPVHPAFAWLVEGPADWRERPSDWPPTRYEEKALREGRRPTYFRFRRRNQ